MATVIYIWGDNYGRFVWRFCVLLLLTKNPVAVPVNVLLCLNLAHFEFAKYAPFEFYRNKSDVHIRVLLLCAII